MYRSGISVTFGVAVPVSGLQFVAEMQLEVESANAVCDVAEGFVRGCPTMPRARSSMIVTIWFAPWTVRFAG
jgi:hypothetical protein